MQEPQKEEKRGHAAPTPVEISKPSADDHRPRRPKGNNSGKDEAGGMMNSASPKLPQMKGGHQGGTHESTLAPEPVNQGTSVIGKAHGQSAEEITSGRSASVAMPQLITSPGGNEQKQQESPAGDGRASGKLDDSESKAPNNNGNNNASPDPETNGNSGSDKTENSTAEGEVNRQLYNKEGSPK